MSDEPKTGWIILPPQTYGIRYDVQQYHMDFAVYPVAQAFEGLSKVGAWCLFDGANQYDLAEHEQADFEIRGSLKWDGCINWETNPDCMMHGCGPGHAAEIGAMFNAVYHVGKRHFDLLGDDVPPLPEGAFEFAGDSPSPPPVV